MRLLARIPGGQPASPEAFLHPVAKTLQHSSLQGSHFKDVMATRSSDWHKQPSGADAAPVHQLDMQPSWDSEPQFWKDILTEQLWQIFAGTHKKVDQLQHKMTEQAPSPESQDPGPHYWDWSHVPKTLVLSPLVPPPPQLESS